MNRKANSTDARTRFIKRFQFAGTSLTLAFLTLVSAAWDAPLRAIAQAKSIRNYGERAASSPWYNHVYSNSFDTFYRNPFYAVPTDSSVVLRIAGPQAMTGAAILLSNVNGIAGASVSIKMHRERSVNAASHGVSSHATTVFYEGVIPAFDLRKPTVESYMFQVQEGRSVAYYGNNGNGYGGAGSIATDPNLLIGYNLTVYDHTFVTPSWLRHGIIYEIFVDRFDNGNKANDPSPTKNLAIGQGSQGETLVPIQFHKNWNSTPYDPNIVVNVNSKNDLKEVALRGDGNFSTDFYGGDLRGIIDKLGYLKSLGVNTLYLTPIFQSESNHKYDTGNFKMIDPSFGTLKTYVTLAKDAHKMGIHLILDGVFEDTGSDSLYFNKFGTYPGIGAWQSYQNPKRKSPYSSWYEWSPGNNPPYIGWSGVDTLPQTNTQNKSYQNFIYGMYDKAHRKNPATNSVAAYWLSLGASGWRLDSANNSNFSVAWWTAFRNAVKKVDPNAAIIGEDWNNPTNDGGVDWMTGTTWDSTMNYPFRNAVISFFRGNYDDGSVQNYAMSASQFNDTMMQMLQSYPTPAMYAEMNLLSSQDVERILTILEGAPNYSQLSAYAQATWKPTPAQVATGVKKLELVTDFQYGFVGVPSIYYGDEAGLIGFKDPLDRGTYPWGHPNAALLSHYRLLGAIRNAHPVLQQGAYLPLYAHQNVIAFARTVRDGVDVLGHRAKTATAIIAINDGAARTVHVSVGGLLSNGTVLHDALAGGRAYTVSHGQLTLTLGALQGVMLF